MGAPSKYSDVRSVLVDFDSVICGVESMDLLFDCLLADETHERRAEIVAEVRRITDLGMSGEIPFSESLSRRIEALPERPVEFGPIVAAVANQISRSFREAVGNWDLSRVHIISSGFRQIIQPALEPLGISRERIQCNTLKMDSKGAITGVETTNPLSGDNGKTAVVEALSLPRKIVIVGDGYTDWQVAESGAADYFFGYVEFVRRKSVVSRADEIVSDFYELTEALNLTQKAS